MHQEHQGSLVLGETSRFLESLGELKTFVGMSLWKVGAFGGFCLLRNVSRYSLSPPGMLLWVLGVGFCVLWEEVAGCIPAADEVVAVELGMVSALF